MLVELYEDKKTRDATSSSKASKKEKGKGKVDKSPSPPSSPSSSSSSSTSSSESEKEKKPKSPLLKLDVKFELPVYDGEINPEKLDNWVKQLEVYCRIQDINDDKTKIQLATLRMVGIALIWWESKTQIDLKRKGKVITSWTKFIKALKKQFYLLGHTQQAVIDWKRLRQGKGQSVQDFTQEFRKKALALGISLDTKETLLKYIGSLHSYLQHRLLMFNPNDFDEVCVQAIHVESGGRPFNFIAKTCWEKY